MEENKPRKNYSKKRHDKSLTFRVSENLLESYRDFCDENGFDISKRLRLHMINDIAKNKERIVREKKGDTSGIVNRDVLRTITQELIKESKLI